MFILHQFISIYIGEKHKLKDYCECNLPCLEAVYVPSLSFAAISTDEDAIKSRRQEEKMANLQEKLTRAREIAYRLADDKYRETMRMLHIIEFRANNLIIFLDLAQTMLEEEKIQVFAQFETIQNQCIEVVQTLSHMESLIRSSLQPTLNHLQSFLIMLDFQVSDYTATMLDSIDTFTEDDNLFLEKMGYLDFIFRAGGQSFNISVSNYTTELNIPEYIVQGNGTFRRFRTLTYFTLLRTRANTVLNSIQIAQNYLLKQVDRTMSSFPNISGVQIVTGEQTHTISNISFIMKSLIGVIKGELDNIRQQVSDGMKIQTNTLELGIHHKYKTLTLSLHELIKNINDTVYNNIVVVLAEVKLVISRLSPKCEYESENLLQIYTETHKQIRGKLEENGEDCSLFNFELCKIIQNYIKANATLSWIARNFQSVQYASDLQSNDLIIGNLLQQNIISLRRLMGQSELIRTNISQYKHDYLTAGQQPLFSYSRSPRKEHDNSPWLTMITKIHTMQTFMKLHIRNLSIALREADKYFQTYADGNILNENFFKYVNLYNFYTFNRIKLNFNFLHYYYV